MIIRKAKDVAKTSLNVKFTGGNSLRLITARDGLGFSVNKTIIPKGGPYHWHYTRHLESCYCVLGLGILRDLDSGESHVIEPETIYALDHFENHTFEALKDTVLISVFNPPLEGHETHDENGHY